jgi:hypothetical protein
VAVLAPGRIKIEPSAAEGIVSLVVASEGSRVRVAVEIVSNERYESLLRGGSFNERGESADAAIDVIATGSVGGGASRMNERAHARRNVFIAAVGAAALLVGIVGVVIGLRQKRRRTAAAPGSATPSGAAPSQRPGAMVCPTCREEYPADAQFCPADGNQLRTLRSTADLKQLGGGVCPVCGHGYDPGVQVCPKHEEELVPLAAYQTMQGRVQLATQNICPICGAQYGGDSRFCGADGAALVPMN